MLKLPSNIQILHRIIDYSVRIRAVHNNNFVVKHTVFHRSQNECASRIGNKYMDVLGVRGANEKIHNLFLVR